MLDLLSELFFAVTVWLSTFFFFADGLLTLSWSLTVSCLVGFKTGSMLCGNGSVLVTSSSSESADFDVVDFSPLVSFEWVSGLFFFF